MYRRAVRPTTEKTTDPFAEKRRDIIIDYAKKHEKELFERIEREERNEPDVVVPEPAEHRQVKGDLIGDYARRFLKYKGGADGINDLKSEKKLTTELREYLLAHTSRSYIQNYTNGIGGLADAVRKRIDLMLK